MRRVVIIACLLLVPGVARAVDAAPPAPLTLSVAEAVLASLANNRALAVQRLAPAIARTGELSARAPFDTQLGGSATAAWERSPLGAQQVFADGDSQRLTLGATRLLPSGTTLGLEIDARRSSPPEAGQTRFGLSVTQALLQGFGSDANLAAVRQARIDTALSEQELRGVTESVVAQVEQACWDYLLAGRRIEIVERSLRLAQDQLAEVRERIAVGRVAEIEQAAAEAEVALRRENLINARSALATTRLKLLRLISPPGPGALGRELVVTDLPTLSAADPDPVETHVALAVRLRPELVQARLQLERGELEVVKTRNGLLPKLDLFVGLGQTGYASSFADSVDPGGRGRDVQGGLTLSFPWENRAARAAERRAALTRERAAESIANLEQLVEVDVRGAWIEVARLREQVAATEASRRLQAEKLRAETEKFRVGKSTAYLVAQAQRDLLQAESDAESAVAGCLAALVDLYRLEGSLLQRRGISVAGR
ncbi:MAG TPA: TolC family protein [Candidatus Methanoperedens sp.]|nr:TolC family protein [Candidatus Methanoperedens sp.]